MLDGSDATYRRRFGFLGPSKTSPSGSHHKIASHRVESKAPPMFQMIELVPGAGPLQIFGRTPNVHHKIHSSADETILEAHSVVQNKRDNESQLIK